MRKVTAGVSAAILLAGIGAACVAISRTDSSLDAIRRQVASEGILAFTLLRLPNVANAGFEPVSPANSFTTGASLGGKFYLAGPGGLAIYDQLNSDPRWLRTGLDLPPAPIVALCPGRLRGAPSTLLLAATQGEGLLLFEPDDPSGGVQQLLPADAADRDITAVLPLASGDLLLGTRRAGVLLYDGRTLRLFQPALAQLAVTALAGDLGDLWIGTRTRGALHWQAGQLDAVDGLPDPQVEDIVIGPEGVFIGTPLGVAQLRDDHVTRVLAPGLFSHALALDGDTLLVATIDQGVHAIPLTTHSSTTAPQIDLTSDDVPPVTHFFATGATLLAVSDDNLLRRGPGGSWRTVLSAPPQKLTSGNIAALSFAPDGRLWIGSFDRGVDVLDLQTNRARHIEDEHVFCINRIVPDAERHTMDVATANGLVLFDTSRATERQVLTQRDGLISDQITDVAFTRSGTALATPAGLTFLTASGAQSLYAFQGLANNHVYAIDADPDSDRVFAGTLGGVSILDAQAVRQNITLRNSNLQRNWITAIARVPQANGQDTWFVGTYGGGIVQMDAAGRVDTAENPLPVAVINPNAMLHTAQRVFAGTLDDGLLVYDLSTRHWTQVLAGLPSRNVTSFAERDGELYIGTENGIVRIAEARLP